MMPTYSLHARACDSTPPAPMSTYLNVNSTIDTMPLFDTIAATNTNKGTNTMTIKTHTNVTSFTPTDIAGTVGDIVSTNLGAWCDAESELHSVSIHDVVNITRRTRKIKGGITVTTITIHTTDGSAVINCHKAEV